MAPKVWDGSAWQELPLSSWGTQTAAGSVTPDDVRAYDGSAWQSLYPVATNPVVFELADGVSTSSQVTSIDYRIPDALSEGMYLLLFVGKTLNPNTEITISDTTFEIVYAKQKISSLNLITYGKRLTASDPGSIITLTFSAVGPVSIVSRAYSSVHADSPLDVVPVFTEESGKVTDLAVGPIAPVTTGAAIVGVWGQPLGGGDTDQSWTNNPPMTDAYGMVSTVPATNNASVYTANLLGSSTSAYSFTGTSTDERPTGGLLIALRPA